MNRILLVISCLVCGIQARGLEVASLFKDHAVLQSGIEIPVWGWGEVGEEVEVSFSGQEVATTVDADGQWQVVLQPEEPSREGVELLVSSTAGAKVVISDVVVGEVWICSGQSNMHMEAHKCREVASLLPKMKNVRAFEVENTVSFDEEDQCNGEWAVGHPDSAVAASFAYHLQVAEDVPVGIILTSWGSSSLEAWMPKSLAQKVPHFKTLLEEFDANTASQKKIQQILKKGVRRQENGKELGWSRVDDIYLRRQTNLLYNAMFHPLIPYGCRGIVWYQGERNTQSMFGMPTTKEWFKRHSGILKYGDTLQAWITELRSRWGRDDLHLSVVMLPGYAKGMLPTSPVKSPQRPESHSWAWMRESQLSVLDLPHTSVACTIDLGDATDIHPKDKEPIGKRLALLAQRDAIGRDVVATGPQVAKVEVEGSQVLVTFDSTVTTVDEKAPREFWLSHDGEKWASAEASLSGNRVVLHSGAVSEPLYVRYAWTGKPEVNLVNSTGLPAYPFRTDHYVPLAK